MSNAESTGGEVRLNDLLGTTLEFKVGDRVKLTRAGCNFYGGAWPNWTPQSQGGGTSGEVLVAGDRPYKPGAAPRPYYVRWNNGAENSYRVEDLEHA